jgi:hypothetical protein
MKNRNKILVGDYLLVILAYLVLAISIVAVNILYNAQIVFIAYAILAVSLGAVLYSLYVLNHDKELLN